MTKVLLTGASGFIGRRVAARLRERRYDVIAVDRSADSDIVLDLLDEDAISRTDLRADALVHLAWLLQENRLVAESPENDRWPPAGSLLVRRFVEAGGTAIVVAGSCFEYGAGAEHALREFDTPAPTTRYGAAKLALSESLMRDYGNDQHLTLAWARIFYPYGPGEPDRKLIPRLCRDIADGRVTELTTPDRLLDYVHVEDVAEGLARMLERRVHGTLNLGSGRGVSSRQIAHALARRLRPELTATIDALPAHSALPVVADVTRMHAELGSWDLIGLETGLADAATSRSPANEQR